MEVAESNAMPTYYDWISNQAMVTIRTYYDWIPNQTKQVVIRSFFYSVTAVVMIGFITNPAASASALFMEGIRAGVVSSLATTIHALTTPFFLAFYIHEIQMPFEFMRRSAVWYVTAAIARVHPALRINLYATIALSGTHMVLALIANNTWRYPTYEPPVQLPFLEMTIDQPHYIPVEWY